MPRQARNIINTEFLHIMVQGINKEFIFRDSIEKDKYLTILLKNIKEFNLQIISYCLMDNHVHLLVFTKDIYQVSKFMQKVNTKYAIYYNSIHNRCGYVFRNRYRCEQIYTISHLCACINYIHNNPVKAKMCDNKEDYKYSSYNNYLYKNGFVTNQFIENYLINYGIDYKDILEEKFEPINFIECKEFSKDNQNDILKEILEKEGKTIEQIRNDKKCLKKIIAIMNIEYNITQKDISQMLDINKVKINRILRSEN